MEHKISFSVSSIIIDGEQIISSRKSLDIRIACEISFDDLENEGVFTLTDQQLRRLLETIIKREA